MTAAAREARTTLAAVDFLHGHVRSTDEAGWVRPWRLTGMQVRALSSCMAWHPGLYRQMAACTAGITVEAETDASWVALEVWPDPEPAGTAESLALVDGDADRLPHDCVSADVDGRALGPLEPEPVAGGGSVVVVRLAGSRDAAPASPDGEPMLPGMADTRRVRFHLPCLRGCRVRKIMCDGATLTPVGARRGLLVLGDSIAQGFVCDDPALAWPRLVADGLGLDLVNQGIGGQVAQPGSVADAGPAIRPARIVVAFGANYRYEPCSATAVGRDLRLYLDEVARAWPNTPCWVCGPVWHDEDAWPSHPRSCWRDLGTLLAPAVARHQHMGLVDGMVLMDHDAALLADGFEHPNVRGMRQIAERTLEVMAGREPRTSRQATDAPAAEKRARPAKPAKSAKPAKPAARHRRRAPRPDDDEPTLF